MNFGLSEMLPSLKALTPELLYQHFHELQARAIGPQIKFKFEDLVRGLRYSTMHEILAPQVPELPERYKETLINEVSESKADLFFFNRSLFFTTDVSAILSEARVAGAKTIVIHDMPDDEPILYEACPEVKFLSERNELAKKSDALKKTEGFGKAKIWAATNKWVELANDSLELVYASKALIRTMCEMELSLDLIRSHYDAGASQADRLVSELTKFTAHPEARFRVKGCSHWLVISAAS